LGQRDVTEYGAVRVHLVYLGGEGETIERILTVEEAIRFWKDENGVETETYALLNDLLRVEHQNGPPFHAPLVRLH
jgi:hypothetical protein